MCKTHKNRKVYIVVCVCYTMNKREEMRLKKIEQVYTNLARLKGKIDVKSFVMDIMLAQEVSERKAKEYLKIAQHKWNQKSQTRM